MLLQGKVAIIPGVSSPRGIDKATVGLDTENRAKVAIPDLDAEAAGLAAADRRR